MEFSSKQVVTMVAAVCAAIVLAPVGVMAATGQLVNITDPSDSARRVKVGPSGTLYTESRAGVVDHSFQAWREDVLALGRYPLYEVTGRRIAITEATVTVRGDATWAGYVRIYSRLRTSGTANCTTAGTGWTEVKTLRSIYVQGPGTVQLEFNGPPLLSQKPTPTQKVCVGFFYNGRTGSAAVDAGIIGYTFS